MHPFLTMLEYESAAAVFTELGAMRSVTPFGYTKEFGENTHLKSEEAWKTFLNGWKDGGELPFNLLFTDASMTALFTLLNRLPNTPLDVFRLTLPILPTQVAPAKIQFNGGLRQLNSNEGSYNSNDPYALDCVAKLSGKPTWTPAVLV